MTAASEADGAWTVNAARDSRWPRLHLSQPWIHRELIFFFALRDVKVRYKQAYLGAAWAALQPIAGAVAFTLLFNELAGVEVEGESYFVFALVGFIVWAYFTTAVNNGTNILLYNSELLTKVALPRIAFPLSALLPGLIELTVGAVLALAAALIWGGGTNVVALVVALPLGTALLMLSALGPALFFSACVVRYRDVATIVGFGLQLFLFVSPVAYPPELVPERWETLQYVNPLAGALALFRAALGGFALPAIGLLLVSALSASVTAFLALVYFRTREQEFVDII
jgi:ABC-type polysaccharide/polyol phosphate export permease